MAKTIKDIDSYLENQPDNVRVILEPLRKSIKKAAPDAEEVISYQMPAFKYHGILVWFAAHKKHVGFYPRVSAIEKFKKELSVFKGAKGSVQFPYDKPLPLNLVSKIVKFRVKENLEKEKAKKKK